MRLEQLTFFLEVSRSNSVSLAASRLYMSQQNVSAAIRKLEDELGFALFDRTHQGVTLTPRGQEVLVAAEEIVAKVEALKLIGQDAAEELTGELRVNMVPYIALPEMIVDFYRYNPEVSIKTSEKSPAEVIEDIRNNEADIGFVYQRMGEDLDTSGFEQEILSEDQLYICVSKKLNFPKHSYTSDAFFEKRLPLVVFNGLYDWTIETIEQMGQKNHVVYRADIQLYRKMVIEGLAAGFATKTGIDQEVVFQKGEVDMFKISGVSLIISMLYKQQPTSNLKEVFLKLAREKFCEANRGGVFA